MNTQRMLELAQGLEELERLDGLLEFDFGHFFGHDEWKTLGLIRQDVKDGQFCGTSGCIAGWACWLWGEDADKVNDDVAQRLLGLTDDQAGRLFYNAQRWITGENTKQFDVSQAQAAQALRRMVEEEAQMSFELSEGEE